MPCLVPLKEAPAREGFFERAQFEAVRARLAPDLQVAVTIAHTFDSRMQSEVLALERQHVDLAAGTLRLDAGMTKNGDARVVRLTPEVRALLAEQRGRVDRLQRQIGQIVPAVFPHLTGRLAGRPRRDARKAWVTACRRAGVPGHLRHDLRRTAVRNLVNLGVPERVAMKITGRKTRAVFNRYHIVSPADLQDAADRLATDRGTGRIGTAPLENQNGKPAEYVATRP